MHHSIADLEEKDLVRHLLSDEQWRQRLLGLYGGTNTLVYPEVRLDGLGDLEGDIDLLLVPPGQPELATAIQVKRIKVSAASFETDAPNKLAELRKLKQQTNPLACIGFWQVYAFVLVAVDSRSHNAGAFSYAGLTASLREKIDAAISLEALAERIGLVKFEFVQPIDDRPLGAGAFRLRPKRVAQSATQPAEVTTWVQQAILRSSAA